MQYIVIALGIAVACHAAGSEVLKNWLSCKTWSPIRHCGTMRGRTQTLWCTQPRGGSVMTFKEVLAQVIDWLQQDKRVSYRALKRQFAIDDAFLADLTYELTEVQQLAVDHNGTVLVWTGD